MKTCFTASQEVIAISYSYSYNADLAPGENELDTSVLALSSLPFSLFHWGRVPVDLSGSSLWHD